MRATDRAVLLRQGVRIADGEVRTVLNRAQLQALYGAKLLSGSRERRKRIPAGMKQGPVSAQGRETYGCFRRLGKALALGCK